MVFHSLRAPTLRRRVRLTHRCRRPPDNAPPSAAIAAMSMSAIAASAAAPTASTPAGAGARLVLAVAPGGVNGDARPVGQRSRSPIGQASRSRPVAAQLPFAPRGHIARVAHHARLRRAVLLV